MPRRGENVRKRKDGRWEGRYYVRERQTGRNVLRSVYAKTYGEVKEKLSAAKNAAGTTQQRGEDTQMLTFGIVAGEWLSQVESEKKHATYVKYRMVYEKHIRSKLGEVPFSDLTPEILQCVFRQEEQQAFSGSLQKSVCCVLNQIFSYAVSHYHVELFSYSRPRNRETARSVEILSPVEQAKLLQCLYREMDSYKLGIVICISTGLRLGEICALKWKDIDLDGKVLYVNATVQRIAMEGRQSKTVLLEGEPKSAYSRREIPLSDELAKLLSLYSGSAQTYVINQEKPMEPRTYQNKFQKYLRSAGVEKKNFHAIRHTFATNCVSGGVDIKSLSEILGHSHVQITLNRYVHPTMETKRQHMNTLWAIYGQFMGQE